MNFEEFLKPQEGGTVSEQVETEEKTMAEEQQEAFTSEESLDVQKAGVESLAADMPSFRRQLPPVRRM